MGLLRIRILAGLLAAASATLMAKDSVRQGQGTSRGKRTTAALTRASSFHLPAEFQIHEKFWTLHDSAFVIRDGKRTIGTIEEKFFTLTRMFTLKDTEGKKIASARQRILSWGVELEIYDGEDRKIGTIKEEFFRSLFRVRTSYRILDASGTQIAASEKDNWLTARLDLKDRSNRDLINMERSFFTFSLTDNWDVRNGDSGRRVDPRLMVMIGAYKTSADKHRRKEAQND